METRQQTELEKQLEKEIYTMRVIVIHECRCGKHFKQVLLNEEQFKKVSDAICTVIRPARADDPQKNELVQVRMGRRKIPLAPFEGMSDFYTEPEINQLDPLE